MAADAGVSLGVVIAGLLINLIGLQWISPVTSFVIIPVILWRTWNLFSYSLKLALDTVPEHIKIEDIREFLESQNEVTNIHDLHIRTMSTTRIAHCTFGYA